MKIKELKLFEPLKIYAAITFVMIAVGAVYFKLNVFKFLPLLISIAVMFLQSKVNRFAFLVGALNSVLYAIAGVYMTLYSTAAYAFFVSFPLQIITFINWNRNTHDGATETKRLNAKGRISMFAIMAGVWLILFAVFSGLGSPYLVIENTSSVIGIVTTVLCMLRYSEYAILQIVGGVIGLYLYIVMSIDDPSNLVWVVFQVYSKICTLVAFIRMNKRSTVK